MNKEQIQNMIDAKTRDLKDCNGADHSGYESLWNERLMLKEMLNDKTTEEKIKNKLAKFWWVECSDDKGEIDFNKIDDSNDFSVIPQNSKGIIQIHVGEFLSIIDEVFKQANK